VSPRPPAAQIDFAELADLTYDDLKEMGLTELGVRRKLFRHIQLFREARDVDKEQIVRTKFESMDPSLEIDPTAYLRARHNSVPNV